MTQGNVDVLCRADGKPMTQDDHDALFEFGAYHMFFRFFMLSLGMEVTKAAEPNVPSTPVPVSEKCLTANIERADGRRVTLEDENALLEFGQFFMVFQLVDMILAGIEASSTGLNDEYWSVNDRLAATAQSPTKHIARKDGTPMTEEDEMALLEFGHLLEGYKFIVKILTWDVTYGLGIFPAADEELMYKTKKYNRNSEGVLMRSDGKPMTQDDHDALAPYGAFVLLGRVAIDIYRAAFGGLANVPIKTKEMKLKRTPSGAELNASLGLSVKAALGLDKKDRKVKIRGLL